MGEGYPVSIEKAIEILGDKKVITAEQVAKAWELEVPADVEIRYSEKTLRKCADQNRKGEADWRLSYINGFTLWEQREMRAVYSGLYYNNHFENSFWLSSLNDKEFGLVVNERPQPGYYLINFATPMFSFADQMQEKILGGLHETFESCSAAVFAETVLSVFKIHDQVNIVDSWNHLVKFVSNENTIIGGEIFMVGPSIDELEIFFVNIGDFEEKEGIFTEFRVVVFWKFEF